MKNLIENIARALVDDPAGVVVNEDPEREENSFLLEVSPDDLGKVIGRRGRTAAAMRTLLSATASRQGGRASLEIVG